MSLQRNSHQRVVPRYDDTTVILLQSNFITKKSAECNEIFKASVSQLDLKM